MDETEKPTRNYGPFGGKALLIGGAALLIYGGAVIQRQIEKSRDFYMQKTPAGLVVIDNKSGNKYFAAEIGPTYQKLAETVGVLKVTKEKVAAVQKDVTELSDILKVQ